MALQTPLTPEQRIEALPASNAHEPAGPPGSNDQPGGVPAGPAGSRNPGKAGRQGPSHGAGRKLASVRAYIVNVASTSLIRPVRTPAATRPA